MNTYKNSIRLLSLIILYRCTGVPARHAGVETTIVKYRIDSDTVRIYEKVFDTLNNIILYKAGNLKINDSVVYVYNYKNDSVEECRFNRYGSDTLQLEICNKQAIKKFKPDNSANLFADTFGLYDELSFREVMKNYGKNIQVDSLLSDSGTIVRYNYRVGEAIYMLLPFIDNHRGAEYSVTLDSLSINSSKRQIISEIYYFEDRTISIRYRYKNGRLIFKYSAVVWPNGERDDLLEAYKYSYTLTTLTE